MTYIIKHRRGDASLWTSANPILADGEFGLEENDGEPPKMKAGDGVTHWNDLDYIAGGTEVESYTDEQVRDVVAALLVAGTNISITPNDGGDTVTIAVTGIPGYTDEQVRDAIAAALVAGSNVTITPNDGADTITIAASGVGSYTDEQVRDVMAAALVAGSGMSVTPNDAGDTITLAATLNPAGHYQVDSLGVGPGINPDYDLIALYITPPVASADNYSIMLLATPQSPNGDDSDPNIDKAALVKHHMDYGDTPGYAHTFQVYAEAGVRGLILGNNNFTELNKAIAYGFTHGGGWESNGYIRFELGPEWPYSERMRLNNGGDLIIGWDLLRSTDNTGASQSGTTVTWGDGGFSAADIGLFVCWGDDTVNSGGKNSEVDRIVGYISPTQVTVERSRTIPNQRCRICKPKVLIDHNGNVYIKGDLTVDGSVPGGGGSPATALADLTDVDLTGEATDDILVRGSDGIWRPEPNLGGGGGSGYGAWGTYTPALSLQTPGTGINLGSTGGITGRYREDSESVEFEVQIKWNGSGISMGGGSGFLACTLPVAAATDLLVGTWLNGHIGQLRAYDVSSGIQYSCMMGVYPDTGKFIAYRENTSGLWGAANPMVPATGDEVTIMGRYRKA